MNLLVIAVLGAIVEIAVWIGVAQFISGWYVFFWFIVAFVIGLNLIRAGLSGMQPQLQQMQMTGQMATDPAVGKKLATAMAGFLFMIPGLVSDVLACLLLIPAVQKLFKNMGMKLLMKRQQAMFSKMMGGAGQTDNPFADIMRQMQNMQNQQRGAAQDGSIIDGEAREVMPDVKRIERKD